MPAIERGHNADEKDDAIRALAACYDAQLLRSDHVVDDLMENGRGWLELSRAYPGKPRLALTMKGRRRVVALLNAAQEALEPDEQHGFPGTRAVLAELERLSKENARLQAHFVQIAAEFNRASSLGNPEACLTQVRRIAADALNGR